MKKEYIIILIFCLLLLGCSQNGSNNKNIIKKCTYIRDQSASDYVSTIDYNIYSSNGIVNKVEQTETIESMDETILDYFNKYFDSQYNDTKKIYGGYDYSISKNNDKLIIKVTIDYEKFNLKEFVKNNPGMENYINNDNKLTLEGAEKMYNSLGATCN